MTLTVEDISPAELETLPLMKDVPFQSAAGWWRAVSGVALPDRYRPSFRLARQNSAPSC